MLASTVQFSNNHQPPTTPPQRGEFTGAGTEDRPCGHTLRHPTACPTRFCPQVMLSTPPKRRQYLQACDPDSGRIINVPPLSNHRRTCADVMALDHQTMSGGLDAP